MPTARSVVRWSRLPLILLVPLGPVSCGGGGMTSPEPPEPVDSPSVSLSVGLNFDNSARVDTLTVAEGESVALEWSTTEDPTSCTASGAWSGSKSASGGEEVSNPLTSVGSVTFTLECQNSGGSDQASVDVEVRDDETFHVRSDREDDVGGEQLHLLYAVPEDGTNQDELRVAVRDSVVVAENWFRSETGGREVRIDTYEGEPDLTFVRLPHTSDEIQDFDRVFSKIREELQRRGFDDQDKKYVAYYDGVLGKNDQGGAQGGPYGAVFFSGGGHALTMIHELLHTLGIVDDDAPNNCDGTHVCDDDRDLMVSSGRFPKKLDVGRDDYYAEDLPDGITNLYVSPFITDP